MATKLVAKSGNIIVAVFSHPIDRSQVQIVELSFRSQTGEELKQQFMPRQDAICIVDGVVDGRVKEGSKIAIAPAAAWPFLAAITQYVFSWAFVATVAVSVGLSYLGGVLFGSSFEQPEEAGRGEQSFGWNPHTTQQEGIPKPMCYGTNMHMGNVIARWTDVDANGDEILYMILDYGSGPVQGRVGNPVYFNDQPATNFPNVTLQDRIGSLNQSCMTGFEKTKLEYNLGWDLKLLESVVFTTPNKFFDDIEYTLEFPKGLWHRHESGGRSQGESVVLVEISEHDQDSWTVIFNAPIWGNTFNPIYKAYKVSDLGFDCTYGKQYDLKFTKIGPADHERHESFARIRRVREVVNTACTYPGRALLGITALATQQLSSHLDIKWVANGKLVNVYDGNEWNIEFSRNRAWVVFDILTQPIISGDGTAEYPLTVERYEGFNPNSLDLAFFYEWAQYCDALVPSGDGDKEEARMPCDIIVDWRTDVWSIAHELAQVGRAHLYWQGTVLTGWVDKAVDDYIDLVTFDNVMLRSWKSAWTGHERAGGVEVHYKDSLQGYERKSLPIYNEDAGLYTRVISIEGSGVTSRSLATRIGSHVLLRNKLIKNINSVRMYKDALRYKIGQVVKLQATVPNWGQSYRIVQYGGVSSVELDRNVVGVVEDDIVFVRAYDETGEQVTLKSYTVNTVTGAVITIKETWEVAPAKNDLVAIGTTGKVKERRIIKITYAANNYFDVVFETYDTNLFTNDDSKPEIPNPDYQWPQPVALPRLEPPVTKGEIMELVEGATLPNAVPSVENPWLANIEWTGNAVDTIYWDSYYDSGQIDQTLEFRYKGVTYPIAPGSTTKKFIYWTPTDTDKFNVTDDFSTAMASGNWLVCVNKSGVPFPTQGMQSLDGGINVLETENAPTESGADVTGGRVVIQSCGLIKNWQLDLIDVSGRPAGVYPCHDITDFSKLDWYDANMNAIKIMGRSGLNTGYGFPLIPIEVSAKFMIRIRAKASAAITGRIEIMETQNQLSVDPLSTHVGISGGTRCVEGVVADYEDISLTTSWQVFDVNLYCDSSLAKYASLVLMLTDTTEEMHVDYAVLEHKSIIEDRDASSEDWTEADLTMDGNWHDLDLSAEVPVPNCFVLLKVHVADSTAGTYIAFRKNGYSGDDSISLVIVQNTSQWNYADVIVPCDKYTKIEYKVSAAMDDIGITVAGWWGG